MALAILFLYYMSMIIHDVLFHAWIKYPPTSIWLRAQVKWMILTGDELNCSWGCVIEEEGDHTGEFWMIETPNLRFRTNLTKGRFVTKPT